MQAAFSMAEIEEQRRAKDAFEKKAADFKQRQASPTSKESVLSKKGGDSKRGLRQICAFHELVLAANRFANAPSLNATPQSEVNADGVNHF